MPEFQRGMLNINNQGTYAIRRTVRGRIYHISGIKVDPKQKSKKKNI
ncbi:MAG: hypothetical protein QMD82_00010 [bacterium]|nr:hypothetical protein [bacterium]